MQFSELVGLVPELLKLPKFVTNISAAVEELKAGISPQYSEEIKIAVAQKLVYGLDDKDYDAVDVAVIPPFTDIRSIQTLVDGDRLRLQYGAQDLSPETGGAFTGDISGSMLAKLGCTYVVIGHSERRAIHSESDALINRKIKAALSKRVFS